MILRIVKMHFKPEETNHFLEFFRGIQSNIEAMPGLVDLKIMRDADNHNQVFTLSTWNSPDDLENYRNSALFEEVWPQTKAMFTEKAEAWSLHLK